MINNTTKSLLGIDDEHIKIADEAEIVDGVIRLTGILDYQPEACHHCGIINEGQIINYGWRKTIVRFTKILENTVILQLTRRNFRCKECQSNFLAQTDLVPKNCSISNQIRKACLIKLEEPVSSKHIADELSTSDAFVNRQLHRVESELQPNKHHLPEIILMDEIKSTKSATGGMSFEFMDAETHQLIDLLPFRTIYRLEKYFYQFDREARENVKIIVTDMNYTYPQLAKSVFPNAIVVMDKFHIINALNRAFNKTRIRLSKKFNTSSREFRALKRYWKLLLVPAEQLDFESYHKWTNFPYWMSATEVVDQLLSLDSELKQTYQLLNQIRTAIQQRDWNNYNAAFWRPLNGSEELGNTIKALKVHHEEIHNMFTTNYSNGPLEGTNNKIKVFKKVSFGYRSFRNFRARILYTFHVHTKKA